VGDLKVTSSEKMLVAEITEVDTEEQALEQVNLPESGF